MRWPARLATEVTVRGLLGAAGVDIGAAGTVAVDGSVVDADAPVTAILFSKDDAELDNYLVFGARHVHAAGTPFDQPCCGSVFRNPGGPRTAGALIDEAGLKGFTIGGAQVSSLHANYIVNTGTATANDVLKLIEHVRKTVAKKMGVELELEVKVVG